MQDALQKQVEELIVPIIEDFRYELVDLELKREGAAWMLRIFIDKPGGITLDDCVAVSREVGAILEIEDPIKSAYRLEVSSPGLDRPLKKPADFERFSGRKVKVKCFSLLDPDERGHARKTFTGSLLGLVGDQVRIEQDDKRGGVVTIPLAEISTANLVEEF